MPYAVVKHTQGGAVVVRRFAKKHDARDWLRDTLNNYKEKYTPLHASRGFGVKAHCFWLNDFSIRVHDLNDNDEPGDQITYIVTEV